MERGSPLSNPGECLVWRPPQKPMGGTLSAGEGLEDTQTQESEGSSKKGGTGRRVLSSWEEAAAWGGVLTQGLLVERASWRGQVGTL